MNSQRAACGIEAPLGPNEAMGEIDETKNAMIGGSASAESLFRYSIVWFGLQSEADSMISNWINRAISRIGTAWSVITWLEGSASMRGALLRRNLERRGAKILVGQLNVAVLPFDPGLSWEMSSTNGTMFVVAGAEPSVDDLSSMFAFDVWRKSLGGGRMATSGRLISWLGAGGRSLIYRKKDLVGHEGVVIITDVALDLEGVVGWSPARVFEGHDAQRVWLDLH
jgi:hypothetical protein